MSKYIRRFGKITIVAGLLLAMLAMYFIIPAVNAAAIANREMKISDSRPSQASTTYDFEGDHSATAVKCLRVQYCTSSSGACTKPTNMTTTSATKGASGDWAGWTYANWTIDNTTDGETKYTYATGEAPSPTTNASFSTATITNSSATGTYFARVTTYTNTDCSTGATDTGTATFAIVAGVTVTGSIKETLSFAITDSAIGFGSWTGTEVRYATADEVGDTAAQGNTLPTRLTVSTNATGTTTITVKDIGSGAAAGLYSTTATKLIPATASTAVSAGSEEYGIYGKNATSLTIDEAYDHDSTADAAVTRYNTTFATGSGVLSSAGVDVQPLAAIASGTPAANDYADTLIFVCTPTY